ncbi:diaminopimelate epimerase [Sinomicrobium soli]|uniref:diaminopimelate epimerase n=1 Tax=Sinomicrobium sp. N-1-3-6 TaxID=2219864 RepID=UPI000DCE0274|nr:diaminopimelate epimerase [Sinomicrobium sp. N-1-3-6]RAV29984.1 diaminopimelate epimerase [Sinomicrobium sp. N-1-3-6]
MGFIFYKYQGTGNDFVMVDNREGGFPKDDTDFIGGLCDRRFGVGADGLILLEDEPGYDFRMVYYNADGNESTMCGNGGRCIVAFAGFLGIIKNDTRFMAVDGVHRATLGDGKVKLQMTDVDRVDVFDNYVFLDTGSPHHVQEVQEIDRFDVKLQGAKLRYGKYGKAGSNINFVSKVDDAVFKVRTYERGVEDETFSCGTGVTAVAIAMHRTGKTKGNTVTLQTPGGVLRVYFDEEGGQYRNIFLEGPAKKVFRGEVDRV